MNFLKSFKRKFIGDRNFYKILWILVLPLIIQQGITNFVSLLDNLMVGRLGTLHMSAVSIANQLVFVFPEIEFGTAEAFADFDAERKRAGEFAVSLKDRDSLPVAFAPFAERIGMFDFRVFRTCDLCDHLRLNDFKWQ